jgi:diaminopimelate decarboxylase/aspartate kinase
MARRELGGYFRELEQLLAGIHLIREVSPRIQARVMGLGELMATRLGAAYLARVGHQGERGWTRANCCAVTPHPA